MPFKPLSIALEAFDFVAFDVQSDTYKKFLLLRKGVETVVEAFKTIDSENSRKAATSIENLEILCDKTTDSLEKTAKIDSDLEKALLDEKTGLGAHLLTVHSYIIGDDCNSFAQDYTEKLKSKEFHQSVHHRVQEVLLKLFNYQSYVLVILVLALKTEGKTERASIVAEIERFEKRFREQNLTTEVILDNNPKFGWLTSSSSGEKVGKDVEDIWQNQFADAHANVAPSGRVVTGVQFYTVNHRIAIKIQYGTPTVSRLGEVVDTKWQDTHGAGTGDIRGKDFYHIGKSFDTSFISLPPAQPPVVNVLRGIKFVVTKENALALRLCYAALNADTGKLGPDAWTDCPSNKGTHTQHPYAQNGFVDLHQETSNHPVSVLTGVALSAGIHGKENYLSRSIKTKFLSDILADSEVEVYIQSHNKQYVGIRPDGSLALEHTSPTSFDAWTTQVGTLASSHERTFRSSINRFLSVGDEDHVEDAIDENSLRKEWILEETGDGKFYFKNLSNKRYLSANSGSTLTTVEKKGSTEQFKIEYVGK